MLKRLELQGFKSFKEKISVDFAETITVIVGPNGSGKSNIIDALRWLLGERDAKNLRGDSGESLIFGGTNSSQKVSLAQASLYFDNSKKIFPLDYEEIIVSRKVFRDGTGEYLINQSQVRLKDVIDLFASSKMGARGLSIINQGNADLFIKASDTERRTMLEEILGLKQYQLKKHEAKLKLQSTKENLEKSKLTTEELLPHLRALKRQTSKWEKRDAVASELKTLETLYFQHKIKSWQESEKNYLPEKTKLENTRAELNKKIEHIQIQIQDIEKTKPQGTINSQEKSQLERELGGLEAELRFASKDKTAKKADANDFISLVIRLKQDLEDLKLLTNLELVFNKVNHFISEINQLINGETISKDTALINSLEEKIKLIQSRLTTLEIEKNLVEQKFLEFNQIIKKYYEDLRKVETEKEACIRELGHLSLKEERFHYDGNLLREQIKDANLDFNEFTPSISEGLLPLNLTEAENRLHYLKRELMAIGEIDGEVLKEANAIEARYSFLTEQITDLEKASQDLEKLIIDLEEKIGHDFNIAFKSANSAFSKFFKELFKDGNAEMILTESGIDIGVDLKQKGVSGINSLSGGERSLLSIAALFALISISPPPFLVFDEVDAALDEKNSRRFAELLKSFKNQSQFILVTHNRSVMEVAEALYGVTMGEAGTSKLMSVKLAP